MKTHILVVLALCASAMLVACGGGGGGSKPVQPPPPQPSVSITTSTLPAGTAGVAYTATLSASGGTAPYHWDVVNGSLPQGLTLSIDGVVSGTVPISGGGFLQTVQFRVMDSSATPLAATKSLMMDVLGFSPNNLGTAHVGEEYASQSQLSATGGTEPLQWSTSGTVPPGISLEQVPGTSGTRSYFLTGKPSQTGFYQFSVTVSDSSSPARTVTVPYQIWVNPALLTFANVELPAAVVGQPYSYTVPLKGGQAPFTWFLQLNSLPAGLTLDQSTGAIFGTPAATSYAVFGLRVQDSFDQSTNWQSFRLLVVPSPLAAHNDTIATAVPILPGDYEASISPYRDQAGNVSPDQDYYQMNSPAGSLVDVSVRNSATRYPNVLVQVSMLDPVMEIVDANGQRFTSCNDPLDDNPATGVPLARDTTPNGFDDVCMNWSSDGESFGSPAISSLSFKVPGTSGNVTYYIHVYDWRGDARPDMFYTLSVATE